VRGLSLPSLRAGQTWRAGDAFIELTAIREPCATLDIYRHADGRKIQKELYDDQVRRGDTASPLWAHSGFYATIRRPGRVSAGAPFELMFQLA